MQKLLSLLFIHINEMVDVRAHCADSEPLVKKVTHHYIAVGASIPGQLSSHSKTSNKKHKFKYDMFFFLSVGVFSCSAGVLLEN